MFVEKVEKTSEINEENNEEPPLRSWQKEFLKSYTSENSLKNIFPSQDERLTNFDRISEIYPTRIPDYYLSLVDIDNKDDPIGKMCIPDIRELNNNSFLFRDPLCEENYMPVDRLIHRYRDRALIISTTTCAMYCRFCTRKRIAGCGGGVLSDKQLDDIVEYLKNHEEIKDVIISGGDPLTLTDNNINKILKAIREISSIDIIRIGTRIPAVLPMRITPSLVDILKKYHPLYLNTHFNHPREITKEASFACQLLIDNGIPVGNQSVLLAGVNDNVDTMMELFRKLVKIRVKPYYLFQCDMTEGIEHLRTPISKGIEIMEGLRGRISGLAIPTYIIDGPNGLGKVPIIPNYIVNSNSGCTTLRNYLGETTEYIDPISL